jgi:staphylococcal nuclease domain-containing protein 1
MKKGLVKAVPSANTVVVTGPAAPGQLAPERTLSLAYVDSRSLRLAGEVSEPFAFEAREFVRSMIAGELVEFEICYSLGKSEFAAVYLKGENINELVIQNGFASVRGEGDLALLRGLRAAEDSARRGKVGIWSAVPLPGVRILAAGSFDLEPFVGTTQSAIVEEVSNAVTYLVLLQQNIGLVRLKLDGLTSPPTTDPNGRTGKALAIRLTSHQQVDVKLNSYDATKVFSGLIIHPKGDVSRQLVKSGLAKLTSQGNEAALSDPYFRELRELQHQAQSQRLCIWEDVKLNRVPVNEISYLAKVVEIHSGDSVTVRSETTGKARKVFLASIRAPALGNFKKNTQDAPWSVDSKEYLRKLTIGQKVKVEIEYARRVPIEGSEMTMEFASLWLEERNVGERLVSQGLAYVINPRGDDETSKYLPALREAEQAAREQRRNIHSTAAAPIHRINDLVSSRNMSKTRSFESSLVGEVRHVAVVDFVYTGARFKVRVPQENCQFVFSILGVRALNPDPNQPEQDKVAKEAIDYAKNTLFQRDVEIEVSSADMKGVFYGTLFYKRKNYAVKLLEQGLGYVYIVGKRSTRYKLEYEAAEAASKAQQVGVFNPRLRALASGLSAEVPQGNLPIIITEIIDATLFYIHFLNDENSSRIRAMMSSFDPSQTTGLVEPVKHGIKCAALYSDGQWYRAQVRRRVHEGYEVFFIDYGNSDIVAFENLRQLTGATLEIPPLAHPSTLAFIKTKRVEEVLGDLAGESFRDLAWDKEMHVRVTGRDRQGTLHVVLSDDPDDDNNTVNAELVGRGLAKITKDARMSPHPALSSLSEREEFARTRVVGIWELEEFSDDEED